MLPQLPAGPCDCGPAPHLQCSVSVQRTAAKSNTLPWTGVGKICLASGPVRLIVVAFSRFARLRAHDHWGMLAPRTRRCLMRNHLLFLGWVLLAALTVSCTSKSGGGVAVAQDAAVDASLGETFDAQGTSDGDVAQADVNEADCPITQQLMCCCDGDWQGTVLCKNGSWGCDAPFGFYTGSLCVDPKGPCSMPGPMDTGEVVSSDTEQGGEVAQDGGPSADSTAQDVATDGSPMDAAFDAGPFDAGPFDAGPADTGPADTGPANDAATDAAKPEGPEAFCLATGGSVVDGQCCSAASDFPGDCAVGGCSCAPQYLKSVKKCQCPLGKCFDPSSGCK